MQPRYTVLSSSGSTPWQVTSWMETPQEFSFAVLSTGGSSYSIDVCLEDPSGTYPSPVSSSPTAFTIFTGSSNALFRLGSTVTAPINSPIAGYRLNLNSQSSAGARVTLVSMQAGL